MLVLSRKVGDQIVIDGCIRVRIAARMGDRAEVHGGRLPADLGSFDVLVDYGTFDDLGSDDRAAYVRNVVPLARPDARFLLWCFEWPTTRMDRVVSMALPMTGLALVPGEVERWFGASFEVERVAGETGLPGWPRGWAAYLMRRRAGPNPGDRRHESGST